VFPGMVNNWRADRQVARRQGMRGGNGAAPRSVDEASVIVSERPPEVGFPLTRTRRTASTFAPSGIRTQTAPVASSTTSKPYRSSTTVTTPANRTGLSAIIARAARPARRLISSSFPTSVNMQISSEFRQNRWADFNLILAESACLPNASLGLSPYPDKPILRFQKRHVSRTKALWGTCVPMK